MNNSYFNGKYNLILCTDYKLSTLPKNVVIRKGKLEDVAFIIRQEELDNDEVFSGNIIINHNFKKIDFSSIFQIKLDDNTLYTTNFEHTPYHHECICEDKMIYCSSFILWIISHQNRKEKCGCVDSKEASLYTVCMSHRIRLKRLTGFEI